jgi:hypothetical protein
MTELNFQVLARENSMIDAPGGFAPVRMTSAGNGPQ